MYVRTKDGVYKVSHYNAYATHKRKVATLLVGYKTSYIKNENIIAQSESLEDLCDKFIAKPCDTIQYWEERTLEKAKIYCGVETIYGAIYTDKGLIYVAKMNEKGELCLL